MGQGRKPKPTHLKAVENSRDRSKAKTVGKEPVPTGLLRGSAAPEHFSDAEKIMWEKTLDATPYGLLRNLDRQTFEMYVEAVCIRADAKRKLVAGSMVILTPSKMPVQSPWLSIINKQTEIINKLAGEMGFTPASRTRIALDGAAADAEDEADKYF